MVWRAITEDSPEREREHADALMSEHLHPIHMAMARVHWMLGDGQGIALVEPSVPTWIDPQMAAQGWQMLTLGTCWITPEQRGKGHFKALLRVLREEYGDNLGVNTHVLEAAGWL
jgi:hypothetical protein